MIDLSGLWRKMGWRLHEDGAIPNITLRQVLPRCLIERASRPDDVTLVRRDDSQMPFYKFRGSKVETAFDVDNENGNHQAASGEYDKLCVWKVDTLTIEFEQDVL